MNCEYSPRSSWKMRSVMKQRVHLSFDKSDVVVLLLNKGFTRFFFLAEK